CPMCGAYTGLFVRTGMLEDKGRVAYQHADKQSCPMVNWQRAVNEIALVDTNTGRVDYGIKSLFKVIGNSFPLFSPLFSFQPFVWLMAKLYAFISYNRKVIIPSPASSSYHIQPAFRPGYRLLYLLFTVWLASLILNEYAPLFSTIIPAGHQYRELLVCGGQVLFQACVILFVNHKLKWEYLGNMMTISLAGALLLLPMLLISTFTQLPQIVYALYILFVAGLMLLEHARRTRLLGLGWTMTMTWVLYRILILLVILNFSWI
ncbi:MAG TPA: hypothetical protein VEB42_16720, partial [Chitinophagaceae bacterium]|nr:hypothetical protein [Chitinophagaceae bacterium]